MESIQELLRKLCKCIVKSDDGYKINIELEKSDPEPSPDPEPGPDPEIDPNNISDLYEIYSKPFSSYGEFEGDSNTENFSRTKDDIYTNYVTFTTKYGSVYNEFKYNNKMKFNFTRSLVKISNKIFIKFNV